MGAKAEDIFKSLTLSSTEAGEYDKVKEAFDSHVIVRRNVIFERAKFNRRSQEPGETADTFINALYCLVEHCDYGTLKEEMIRDRLVVGLSDKRLPETLQLDSKLTLSTAVIKVRQSEAVKKQ